MRTVAVIFTDRRIPLSEVSSYKKYKFLCNYDIISPLGIIEDPRYNSKMMVVGFTSTVYSRSTCSHSSVDRITLS